MGKAQHRMLHLTAATVFAIVAVVHAWRLLYRIPLAVGAWVAPFWASWLAVIIAGMLAVTLWRKK